MRDTIRETSQKTENETVQETINGTGHETLVDDNVVDGLDPDDTWWGLEFLDARNPKKLTK